MTSKRRDHNGVIGSAALLIVTPLLLAVACPCRALDERTAAEASAAAPDWIGAEFAVFGHDATATWQGVDGGASDVGGVRRIGTGGGRIGNKVKAGLLSLLLPGAGQYYNGDAKKAYIFAGVEAAVWASYLTFDIQGDNRSETYKDYAGIYAGVATGAQDDAYWRAVAIYMDSDAYNEDLLREARALNADPSGLITPADAWQWSNEDRLQVYKELRADASRAYDRRDFMTLFAILNRVVAVYDAVRSSVDDKLQGDVLGFHVEMNVSPSLRNPGTGCVVTRKF